MNQPSGQGGPRAGVTQGTRAGTAIRLEQQGNKGVGNV
jgi:hypothetical protein